MNNTISQVNFGGWFTWGEKMTKVTLNDNAEMLLQKVVYHRHPGETDAHAAEVMKKVIRGNSFDSFVAPNGLTSSNNVSKVKGHYDLVVPVLGDTFTSEMALKANALSVDDMLAKTTLQIPEGREVLCTC